MPGKQRAPLDVRLGEVTAGCLFAAAGNPPGASTADSSWQAWDRHTGADANQSAFTHCCEKLSAKSGAV